EKLFFFVAGEFFRNPGLADQRTTSLAPTPAGIALLKSNFPNNAAIQYWANAGALAIPTGNPEIPPDVAQTKITLGGIDIPLAAVQRLTLQPTNRGEYNIRVDSKLGTNHRISGRSFPHNAPGISSGSSVQGWNYDQLTKSVQAGGAWLYNLSARSLNEVRFNYLKPDVTFGRGCEGGTPACV